MTPPEPGGTVLFVLLPPDAGALIIDGLGRLSGSAGRSACLAGTILLPAA